jgi:predicted nucleic acid-binding protein
MTLYIESNYLLEIAKNQEQAAACESLLQLAEQNRLTIVLPEIAIPEAMMSLQRSHDQRRNLQRSLQSEARELRRTAIHGPLVESITAIATASEQVIGDELSRFNVLVERLLLWCDTIPVTRTAYIDSQHLAGILALEEFDALIVTVVASHAVTVEDNWKAFTSRNTRDFDQDS